MKIIAFLSALIVLCIRSSNSTVDAEIVALYPEKDGKLLYKPLAKRTSDDTFSSLLLIDAKIKNTGSSKLKIEQVKLVFPATGAKPAFTCTLDEELKKVKDNKTVLIKDDPDIDPGESCRLLLLPDQVLSFPAPSQVTIRIYFKGYAAPLTAVRKLQAHRNPVPGGSYRYPAKASDLKDGEFWSGSTGVGNSHHRKSLSQAYAHDVGVSRWDKNAKEWTNLHPGKDGKRNSDYLIWGKPIYAMADGEVIDFNEDNPDDPPGEDLDKPANSFTILHGDEKAWYGHLQKGTLNKDLLKKGIKVKAGQYLGKAGNSGISSHPHLHIHVSKDGVGLPLLFHDIYIVNREAINGPSEIDSDKWTKVEDKGFSQGGNLVYPGKFKPVSKPVISGLFAGVFDSGDDQYYMWAGASWENFNNKRQELLDQNYKLIDVETFVEDDKRLFSGVWRQGGGKFGFFAGMSLGEFNTKRNELDGAGLRLIDVETYQEGNTRRFLGVWEGGTDKSAFEPGASWRDFNEKRENLAGNGLGLIDVEIFRDGSDWKYAGVWRSSSLQHAFYSGMSWDDFLKKGGDLEETGFRLIDFEVVKDNEGLKYTGIWQKNRKGAALWVGVNYTNFREKWSELADQGYRLIDIERY